MDEEKNEDESATGQWIKDNLRIIVSVIIVIAIAGGIYSYSKRTQPVLEDQNKVASEEAGQEESIEVSGAQETAETTQDQNKGTTAVQKQETKVAATTTSKETEGSFVETAGRGDGVTHLARKALANYLEKNPDSTLTPEHKIYIEDYLRKHVGYKGGVRVGTSIEFEKDLVRQAIDQSKKLNDNQLRNLHKYAVLVPSLS